MVEIFSRRESNTWLCGILHKVSYTIITATRIYTPVASNSAQRQLDQSNIPINNGEAQYSLKFSFSKVLLVSFCEFLCLFLVGGGRVDILMER